MAKFPLLSDRLRLRLIGESDLMAIHDLHSIPEVDEYNTLGIPKDLAETKAVLATWLAKQEGPEITQYTFAIELKEEETAMLGLIALSHLNPKYRRAEVWYKFQPKSWGKGYGTEALACLINFAFDQLHLHRIEAGCAIDNIGSIRVLEKVGMQREGRKRQVLPLKSGWSDNFEYAILESDKPV